MDETGLFFKMAVSLSGDTVVAITSWAGCQGSSISRPQ